MYLCAYLSSGANASHAEGSKFSPENSRASLEGPLSEILEIHHYTL